MASRRRLAVGFGLVLVAALLAGCAGRYGGANEPPPNQVTIHDDRYDPETIEVGVNATIQWKNEGSSVHTVTFYDGPGDAANVTSLDLEPGDRFTFTPDQSGVYRYRCRYHSQPSGDGYGGMTGKIVVG